MRRRAPGHAQRLVARVRPVGCGAAGPVPEQPADQPELGPAVVVAGQRLLRPAARQLAEQPPPGVVVDGPAVVRVHQGQIPQLGALVEVGDARAGQQQRRLGQRVDPPELDDPVRGQERLKLGDENLIGQQAGHERVKSLVIARVRVGPGGVHLGLPDRLPHERPGPLRPDRPGADQRLVQQVLGAPVRPAVPLVPLAAAGPGRDGAFPFPGQLRQQADPRPDVAAPLGVMGGEGQHGLRPPPCRVRHRPVEVIDRGAEPARIAAHLVQRDQRVVPVERGILPALGHDRRADLGEAHREVGLGLAGNAERQQLADERQQLGVEVRPAAADPGHGGSHLRLVSGRDRMPGADVAAVHAEGRDHLAQHLAQLPVGVIPLAAVTLANVGQQAGEALHLGRQVLAHDLQLGRVRHVRVGLVLSGEPGPDGQHRGRIAGVDEELADVIQEVIAGCPRDRPGRGQFLPGGQDLLHHDVPVPGGLAQPVQVALGVGEAVHVIDPQPVDCPFGDQAQDDAVGRLEDGLVFHPQPGERLDVEEPAVGQFLGRRPPVGQPVVLLAEQLVERVGVAVQRLDLGVDRRRHVRPRLAQPGQPGAQHLLVVMPLGHRRRVGAVRVREPAECGRHVVQLVGAGPRRRPGEQVVQRARRQRCLVLVVADAERPAPPLHGQLPRLQHPAVVVAEDRHQHRGRQLVLRRVPVDVEMGRVPARRPVLQHVPPPGVGPAGQRHVVGHDVEHLAESRLRQPPGQPAVGGLAAELGVEPAVVDDVVTVRAALGRLQVGRAVQVTHAEAGQVAGDGGSVVEGEAGMQLDAVGSGPRAGSLRRRGGHRGLPGRRADGSASGRPRQRCTRSCTGKHKIV